MTILRLEVVQHLLAKILRLCAEGEFHFLQRIVSLEDILEAFIVVRFVLLQVLDTVKDMPFWR